MGALNSPELADDESARVALREFFEELRTEGGTEFSRVLRAFVDSHQPNAPAEIDWSDDTPDGSRIAPSRSRGATNGR